MNFKILTLLFTLLSLVGYSQVQLPYLGTSPNDGTGDNLRTAMEKLRNNDAYLDTMGVQRLDSLLTAGVGESYTASNGVTLDGTNFKLGGELTTSTTIKIPSNSRQFSFKIGNTLTDSILFHTPSGRPRLSFYDNNAIATGYITTGNSGLELFAQNGFYLNDHNQTSISSSFGTVNISTENLNYNSNTGFGNVNFYVPNGGFAINNDNGPVLSADIFNGIPFAGWVYGDDYSPNFTDRSLIDKGFGDNNYWKTSGTTNVGIEGLRINTGNAFTELGVPATSGAYAGIVSDDVSTGIAVQRDEAGWSSSIFDSNAGGENVYLWFDLENGTTTSPSGGGVTFVDNRTTKKGIEYAGDYSATFTTRSLIDKGYADNNFWKRSGTTTVTDPTLDGNILIGPSSSTIAPDTRLDVRGLSGGSGRMNEVLRLSDDAGNRRISFRNNGAIQAIHDGLNGSGDVIFSLNLPTGPVLNVTAGGSLLWGLTDPSIHKATFDEPGSPNRNGTQLVFNGASGLIAGQGGFLYRTLQVNHTSGTSNFFNLGYSGDLGFKPSSGTGNFNVLNINFKYNTTGTYSGTVRGIYYNPLLTSTTGMTHIAYENTSGQLRFGGMTRDDSKTQILVKDATTNQVFYRDASTISSRLMGSATLDFPSTDATTVSRLTIPVTGAAIGDPVSLGIPTTAVTATGTYSTWVSAVNTVTVQFSPKATEDPASGTFKVTVHKP